MRLALCFTRRRACCSRAGRVQCKIWCVITSSIMAVKPIRARSDRQPHKAPSFSGGRGAARLGAAAEPRGVVRGPEHEREHAPEDDVGKIRHVGIDVAQ